VVVGSPFVGHRSSKFPDHQGRVFDSQCPSLTHLMYHRSEGVAPLEAGGGLRHKSAARLAVLLRFTSPYRDAFGVRPSASKAVSTKVYLRGAIYCRSPTEFRNRAPEPFCRSRALAGASRECVSTSEVEPGLNASAHSTDLPVSRTVVLLRLYVRVANGWISSLHSSQCAKV